MVVMHITRKNIVLISTCLCILGVIAGIRLAYRESDITPQTTVKIEKSAPVVVDNNSTVLDFKKAPPFVSATTTIKTTSIPAADVITARAYLVGDVKTGTIYFERNSVKALPVASMSKLITAIVATDTLSPTTTITVTDLNMSVATDTSKLASGEIFTMHELLYPMLLNSSNNAAEALASTTDRSTFLALMSSYAWEVGAATAFFADPSGLDPRNVASAQDLFSLSRYLYNNRPDILELTRVASTSVATTTEHGAHVFTSIHPFIKDPRFIGGKTGHTTEAGDTMMTLMYINDHDIVFIILGAGSSQRAHDTTLLISLVEKVLK